MAHSRALPTSGLFIGKTILLLASSLLAAASTSNITGVWANDGGDKVSQDELRASNGVENLTGKRINRLWDGTTINLFGAENESVSFNLILEAATATAQNVSVSFNSLTGPNGASIQTTRQASGDDLYNYVGRPIELFYVRYLQILGLSAFGWFHGDERQFPIRFQAPSSHLWTDRPDHNKNYPDPLIPMELVPTFSIRQGQNQAIWADVFIAKNQTPGVYTGTVSVKEAGVATRSIPVRLTVLPFALPDTPTYIGFTNLDATDLQGRWFGRYINWQTAEGSELRQITDRYVQYFKRNRITPISGEQECAGLPLSRNLSVCGSVDISVQKRLDGTLFSPAKGYDGPGISQGLSLYSYATYGAWDRTINDEQTLWNLVDPIGQYLHTTFPNVEAVMYLQDEPPSSDFSKVESWAKWISEDPGPGHFVKTLSTTNYGDALKYMPDLDIAIEGAAIGECYGCPNGDNYSYTQGLTASLKAEPNHDAWLYNYNHPGSGTSNTEDDGIAMRTFGWIQHKLKISHYFYWYANVDSQDVDTLSQACTWGCNSTPDGWWGQVSPNAFTNGNGLMVYPGTDNNPGHVNYGVNGPLGSLRLKEWRRGIEDGDYLAIAQKIDPDAVKTIVQRVMPKALWENQAPGGDVSYFYGNISWSSDPDIWESARAQLAQIISNYCLSSSSSDISIPCSTQVPISISTTQPAAPAEPTAPALPSATPGSGSQNLQATNSLNFVPVDACRLLDTRNEEDGPFLAAEETRQVAVAGSRCNIPQFAKAFAMNMTVVPHGRLPYVTAWPTGSDQPVVSSINSYDGRVKANALIIPAGANGSVAVYAKGDTDLILDISGYFVEPSTTGSALAFFPVTPCRVVDTRTQDAGILGGPFIPGGSQRIFPFLQSSCGLPSTAQAYSLNYTAVPHNGLSWLTAWAGDQAMPLASILNSPTNAVTANAAITKAALDGSISIYVHDDADVIVDVNGYFAPPGIGGMNFYTVLPCRAFDSRSTLGPLQGVFSVTLSTANCGIPTTARVAVLNATAVPWLSLAYLSLWPAGTSQPIVSTLNAFDGQVTSNLAIVPSTTGNISAYLADKSDIIFDVFGYFQD